MKDGKKTSFGLFRPPEKYPKVLIEKVFVAQEFCSQIVQKTCSFAVLTKV